MELDYIKEIQFTEVKTNNDYSLFFKTGVNIIIGAKGAGKSSLLNILHAMHQDYKPEKWLTDMLSKNGIHIKKIIYQSGNEKTFNSLNKLKKNEINTEDLISQGDEIKNKIDQNEEILKAKENFINKNIEKEIKSIENLFNEYFLTYTNIHKLRSYEKIDWSKIKLINQSKNSWEANFINCLQQNFANNKNTNIDQKIIFQKNVEFYKKTNVYYNDLVKENLLQDLNKYLKSNTNFSFDDFYNLINKFYINNILDATVHIKTYETLYNILNSKKNDVKSTTNTKDIFAIFKMEVNNWIKNLSSELAKNQILFKKLFNDNLSIYINDELEDKVFGIVFKINTNIGLGVIDSYERDNDINEIEKILSDNLYSPNNDKTLWINWLKKSYESEKPIKANKINSSLTKAFFNKAINFVSLEANGQDYQKMSLGTRTSFGIKQRIKTNTSNYLFLDQPEDNLDNYTIFKELVPIINGEDEKFSKKINQTFIVTHNPNFGVLTNPKSITVCNLQKNKIDASYIQKTNIYDAIAIDDNFTSIFDSPALHFLEGSKECLDERYNILIKKEGNK